MANLERKIQAGISASQRSQKLAGWSGEALISLNYSSLNTVLCLGCHVDDIEIGCGGTILQLQRLNPDVAIYWIVFSASRTRKREAFQSVERLPFTQNIITEVLEYPDTYFPAQWAQLKNEFQRLKNEIQPDLIFTHRRDDRHQDHNTIGDLTWNAFRNHNILEYEIPKYEGDLGQPNVFVPLDEQTCQFKCDWILQSFPSQWDKHWLDRELLMSTLRLRGVESGQANRYAEGFYCSKLLIDFQPV